MAFFFIINFFTFRKKGCHKNVKYIKRNEEEEEKEGGGREREKSSVKYCGANLSNLNENSFSRGHKFYIKKETAFQVGIPKNFRKSYAVWEFFFFF